MRTKILRLSSEEDLKVAGKVIKNGGLVAFPTETVYGLGANGLNETAVKNIFIAKGRPSDNPLILHISQLAQVDEIGEFNETAKKIAEVFWPGPITIIINKRECVPLCTTGGLNTVAVRMPSNEIARQLISHAKVPIAAPSANISGRPSPTMAKHVIDDLNGKIDIIIDGGNCEIGIESTVVDTTGEIPVILRPGGVTLEMLKEIFPKVQTEKHVKEGSENYRPKSPGMKYKHYSPKAKVIVFEGNAHDNIILEIEKIRAENKKVGVFCKNLSDFHADFIIRWGETSNDMAAAAFRALRDFDNEGMDFILCEMPEKGGIGEGVRNRLYKAAGYDIR